MLWWAPTTDMVHCYLITVLRYCYGLSWKYLTWRMYFMWPTVWEPQPCTFPHIVLVPGKEGYREIWVSQQPCVGVARGRRKYGKNWILSSVAGTLVSIFTDVGPKMAATLDHGRLCNGWDTRFQAFSHAITAAGLGSWKEWVKNTYIYTYVPGYPITGNKAYDISDEHWTFFYFFIF